MKKLIQILMIAVIAIATSGCGFRPVEEFAISNQFSSEQQDQIVQALEEWFEAVPNARVNYYIGEGASAIAPGIPKGGCGTGDKIIAAKTALNTFDVPKIIVCMQNVEEYDLNLGAVIRHELGHALSTRDDHLKDHNTMAPQLEVMSDSITKLDVEYVSETL
jgi:hypothetical protein